MKKLFSLLLALVVTISLTACDDNIVGVIDVTKDLAYVSSLVTSYEEKIDEYINAVGLETQVPDELEDEDIISKVLDYLFFTISCNSCSN